MLKRFAFRLQRVLDAKESEEKERQRELGEAQGALLNAEKRLAGLKDDLKEQVKVTRALLKREATVAELRTNDDWQHLLRKKIRMQADEIVKLAEAVEQCRIRLLEVTKEKKVLEKLREKQFEEHQKEMNTIQQNQLDDIGSRSAAITRKKNNIRKD